MNKNDIENKLGALATECERKDYIINDLRSRCSNLESHISELRKLEI